MKYMKWKKQLNKEVTWLALKAAADVDIYGHLKTSLAR